MRTGHWVTILCAVLSAMMGLIIAIAQLSDIRLDRFNQELTSVRERVTTLEVRQEHTERVLKGEPLRP